MSLRVAGLFAGIGGIERGLDRAGHRTELLCESWEPAQRVLAATPEFAELPIHQDVTLLEALPSDVDAVTAGFPCQDLSQAGMTAGIHGRQSSLVAHVFKLLRRREDVGRPVTWLLIENVQNMLALDRGAGMRYLVNELEALGCRWAYRVVDSRFCGVPQRRRRVLLVASPTEDPRPVLFAGDAQEPDEDELRDDAFGFYWTEGLRGLGWAHDAIPTLKGGSAVGIPSPPAIWLPDGEPGSKLVVPSIEDAEALQGFPRGATAAADQRVRNGPRWRLVGNAVTVGVAAWLGHRFNAVRGLDLEFEPWRPQLSWPTAAWGEAGKIWRAQLSEFPTSEPYEHLLDVVDRAHLAPLSNRAARGFWGRLQQGNLGRTPGFRDDVEEHVELTR